jgi:hypothetical protein
MDRTIQYYRIARTRLAAADLQGRDTLNPLESCTVNTCTGAAVTVTEGVVALLKFNAVLCLLLFNPSRISPLPFRSGIVLLRTAFPYDARFHCLPTYHTR